MAYIYKYLAGKMTRTVLLTYLFWAAVILICYALKPSFPHLVVITAIYFLLHVLWDEQYLMRLPMDLGRSPMHLGRSLEMTPLLLIYSGRVIDAMFPSGTWRGTQSPLVEKALWVCLLVIPIYLVLVARGYRPDLKSAFYLGCGALLAGAASGPWLLMLHPAKFTGSVIIYHYLIWYTHYFLNLPSGQPRRVYLVRILAINALVVGGYALWAKEGVGRWIFKEDAFYIWTLLHLVNSTRSGDLRALLKWPKG